MTHHHNDNSSRTQHFAVLDIEMLYRQDAFQAYSKLDPNPALVLRYPFRSTCAAALLTFSISDGVFEFGHLDSWAGDDEPALLRALFDRLHMLPDHRVTTWGGLSMDLPVLRIGAARHHLRLPRQLIKDARQNREWLHLDLGKEHHCGTYVHMSEVAVALNLPVKFADSAASVRHLLETAKLQRLRNVPVADVVTTALLLQSQLETHGDLVSARVAQIVTLRGVARRRPEARFADYLRRVQKRLATEVMVEAEAFIAAAA